MVSLNTNLTKVLSPKYARKWVALNERQTQVVASGKSPSAVLKVAQRKGIKSPILTYVIKDYGFLVP